MLDLNQAACLEICDFRRVLRDCYELYIIPLGKGGTMISVSGFVLHYFTACAVFTDGAALPRQRSQ